MKILGINKAFLPQRNKINFKSATIISPKDVSDKFVLCESEKTIPPEQKRFVDIFSKFMEIKKKEDKKFEKNFNKFSKFRKKSKSKEKELLEKQINEYLEKEFTISGSLLEHFKKLAKIAHYSSTRADEKTTNEIVQFIYDNQEKKNLEEAIKFSTKDGVLNIPKAKIMISLASTLNDKESVLVLSQIIDKYVLSSQKNDEKIVENTKILYQNLHANRLVEELLIIAKNKKTGEIDPLALKKITEILENYINQKYEKENTFFISLNKDDWQNITQKASETINIARNKITGEFNPNYKAKILNLSNKKRRTKPPFFKSFYANESVILQQRLR